MKNVEFRITCRNSFCPWQDECARALVLSGPLSDGYDVVCDGTPRIERACDMHGEHLSDEKSEKVYIVKTL